MNILNGANVASERTVLGVGAGAIGSVLVDGAGSVWNSHATVITDGYMGSAGGVATITIQNGAVMNSRATPLKIGETGGTAVVTVRGKGSQLNMTVQSNLRVGYHGAGTLNVLDGAVVNSNVGPDSKITVGALAGSTGTINIGEGYTIDVINTPTIVAGLGTVYLPPNPPTGLTSSNISKTSISWDWDDIEGVTGYRVYNATDNALLAIISSATSNWTQDLLNPNTTYSIYVRGVNDQGVGYASISASATTEKSPEIVIDTLPSSGASALSQVVAMCKIISFCLLCFYNLKFTNRQQHLYQSDKKG